MNNNTLKSHRLEVKDSYLWDLEIGKESLSSLSESLTLSHKSMVCWQGYGLTVPKRNLDVAQATPADLRGGHLAMILSKNKIFRSA